jgi:hydroxymethylpyrimidine pyrophosphatase-like HAD family hydrolase
MQGGKMTYVFDIDDTLFWSDKYQCDKCQRVQYKMIRKDQKEIDLLNNAYDNGHTIILWTGRNWDCYDLTIKQLKEADIKYHQLIMGKPQGIYIDKDAVKSLSEVL